MDRSRKILVVEDERGIRSLLWEVLSKEGFEVLLAKDGQESLSQMKDRDFDLVITDIKMPRVNGIKMLKSMKKAGRKEKVIVMSGDPSDFRLLGDDMPCIVSQFQKPFRIHNLVNAVAIATGCVEDVSQVGVRQTAMG